MARLLATLVVLLFAAPLLAQSQTAGDITVHYSAIPTLDLDPTVARNSAITRSANRALLNIAVRRRQGEGDVAVEAEVSGTASNDAGQMQSLAVRRVREGDAIYYLAEPRLRPGDTLRFELSVLPEGAIQPIAIRFSRPFPP
jgi:hypothetical protein